MLPGATQSRLAHWLLILLVFLPTLACTLPVMQFTDSMESFNVLSAVEIARDGHWAIPTLWGRPRLEKPPLVQWLTAIGILTGGPLEFSSRWPTLVLSCLALIVIYEWTRLFANVKTALIAAAIAGSTMAFLRFSRRASYDTHLMFWVTLTNYALTWVILRRRVLPATLLAGLALGGALMSKGPPALLHTLLPVGVFAAALDLRQKKLDVLQKVVITLLLVLGISVVVMLPWLIAATHHAGGIAQVIQTWRNQIGREYEHAEGLYTSPIEGFVFLAMLAPWTLWYIGSFVQAWRERNRLGLQLAFLLTLSLLPVIIHAFIPPMRDRYLLPMLPPAAIACAIVVSDWLDRIRARATSSSLADRLAYLVHLAIALAFVAGYPLYFAFASEDRIPLAIAATLAAIGLAVIGTAITLRRRFPEALVIATVFAMLQAQAVFAWHQNRELRPQLLAGRQVAADPRVTAIAAYENNVPPRAFAIAADKRFFLVFAPSDIPANYALLTEKAPPDGWVRVLDFRDGRHLWTLWQMPSAAGTIAATYGK